MKKILLILSISVLAFTARGNSIVFDTFGPGDTYQQNLPAYAPQSDPSGFLVEVAAQFTAAASGNLVTVDLGLTYDNPEGPQPVNVYLYGDAMGLPDNANQTFLGSGTPTALIGTTNNSLVSFAVAGTIPVTIGSTYWLVLKPAATFEFDLWNFSSPAITGSVAGSNDDSTWLVVGATLPAFRLTATSAVSTPDSGGTILLMLGSVAALLVLHRILQRQRASR